MGLIFIEGFDSYGTTDGDSAVGFLRKWPTTSFSTSGLVVAAGRINGKALYFFNSFDRWLATPVLVKPTLTIGFAFRFTAFSSDNSNAHILYLYEGANLGINVRALPSGELAVYLNNTQLAVTTSLGLLVNTWHYIELSVTVHNTTGSFDLHLNDSSILSASNIDTQSGSNAWTDTVRIGKISSSGLLSQYDDFYVRDDTTFLHSPKITTRFPVSDAAVDSTPSTGGDNFAMVDDANAADDDDTYVDADSGDADLYGFDSIDASEVHGVVVNAVARETDSNHLDISLLANSDASDPQTIGSTDYVHRSAIWELNPDTGLPWTPSEVNAAEFGFEVT